MRNVPAKVAEQKEKNVIFKVKKGTLVDRFTCLLCFNILRQATAIGKCLHTFCKECIYQKFEDEHTNCCPLCNVDLGAHPTQSLRSDNNLQDIIQKVFPLKKSRHVKTTVASTRKKKISISSLVIAPKTTTKRASSSRGKAAPVTVGISQESGSRILKGKEIEKKSRHGPSSSLQHSANRPIVNRKQVGASTSSVNGEENHVNAEALSVPPQTADGRNNSTEQRKNFQDLNKSPIVETPETNSNGDSSANGYDSKEQRFIDLTEERVVVTSGANGCDSTQQRLIVSTEQRVEASVANEAANQSFRRLYPVWFTLIACEDDKKGAPLPQLPKPYLNIKDGSATASSVAKYIVMKLNLRSESEVEVMCCGQAVVPTATLRSLANIWVRSRTFSSLSNKDPKKYVMVLNYRRK